MQETRYRVWAPPESRVRIEYSTDVISQLSVESAKGDAGGILLGTRRGDTVRVLKAATLDQVHGFTELGSTPGSPVQEHAARPNGLALVGIFSVRKRGEVFLTDSDLQRFEQAAFEPLCLGRSGAEAAAEVAPATRTESAGDDSAGENVALVLAGAKGGFFVRDNDGSIQAIRSYHEFQITDGAPDPTPAGVRAARVRLRWSWLLLSTIAAAIPLFLPPFLSAKLGTLSQATHRTVLYQSRPHSTAALDLTIQGGGEALRIGWNRFATGDGARLEIVDGPRHTAISVSADLSSVTYEADSGDVEVQLTAANDAGDSPALRHERAHFIGDLAHRRANSPDLGPSDTPLANLQLQGSKLRSAMEGPHARNRP